MTLTAATRVKINLVAFLVLGLGLSYLMATKVLTVLHGRYTVSAIFEDGGGVFTNQEVTYRGVTVGQVGELSVVEEGVKIDLLIEDEFKIPSEGIEARVMFKSAVGEQFVDLLPEAEGEPYLEQGDEIPLAQTSIPVSTQELLATLEAVLRGVPPEALKGAVDALGIGLTGLGPDIGTILESTADLAELFAERAPEVESLLRRGTRVGDEFLASQDDFVTAIKELVTVSDSLASGTGDIEALLRNTNLTSDEAVALLREDRVAVHEFLQDFAEVNAIQAEHGDDLKILLQQLPRALGNVNKSFEPTTGLIRFGLIQEQENPACSYGSNRRPPEERDKRMPPKKLRCENTGQQQQAVADTSGIPTNADGSAAFLPGVTTIGDMGLGLPARMSDWSWTLFYLHGV